MSAICLVKRCFSSSVSSRCASAAMRSTSAMVSVVDTDPMVPSTARREPAVATDRFVRPSSVAGRWYPGDPRELASEVDGYLARADVGEIDGRLRAIVAPHAGLMYSGPVAAHAYAAARRSECTSIVLVGPSHFVPFQGVSIWPAGSWQT